MNTVEIEVIGGMLWKLAERLKIRLPTRYYLTTEPDEMIEVIAMEMETAFDDWEVVYDKAVMEAEKWQTKYNRCLAERNQAFRLLKLGLIHGVITGDETSVLLKMMESSCGSDVSNVAK